MPYNYSPGRINEEKTPEQCYLGYRNSQRIEGGVCGTGAQVGDWMINKCKAQMIGKGLYNM